MLPMHGLRADVARLALACPPRISPTATVTASAYFLFALYCSAPPAFLIFFTEMVMATLLPVLLLARCPQ